jgi:hypothetical protein
MTIITRNLICTFTCATALLASGGGTKQNPTPANTAEVHTPNALVPAGGTLQAKFLLTEPRPVTSTGTSYFIGDGFVNGLSLWSINGVAGGVGVVRNGWLYFEGIDPSLMLGTNVDYPFLTITTQVNAGAVPGTTSSIGWASGAYMTGATGPFDLLARPGTLTIGGSISIHGVYPGGGTWPAGTVIRMTGSGFKSNTHLQTAVKFSSFTITPQEIDLVLKEQTTMDSQSFQVVNPDGSADTYFSYMRGTLIHQPSRLFLQAVEPAFPLKTGAIATLGPVPAPANSGQYLALALQNNSPGPLVVTLQLTTQGTTATVLLPSTGRVVDAIADLFGGVNPLPGETVAITSTSPVQILGIMVDESAGTVAPVLPVF